MTEALERLERRNRHFDTLVHRPGLMWLGQNTNHLAPHPAVRDAMIACIDSGECHAYAPPLGLEELRSAILADLGLDSMFSVIVTDGAIEGLYHVCHTLLEPGDDIIVTDPGWVWPRHFATSCGARVVTIPIYDRANGFRLVPDQLREALTPRTRLVYLVDPNNPLGSAQTPREIEEIAVIARNAGAVLVHDCTYRHFADRHTLAATHYPEGTITTYSFSKWLGLAGLRLGAVVAGPAMIESLAKAPPNNLGSSFLAQRAALAGLAHKDAWFPAVQQQQRANQLRIRSAIDDLDGLEILVWPSQANFVAIDVARAGVDPDRFCAFCLERDILVRQGRYHSNIFADRFIKVSTTVPATWIESFCRVIADGVQRSGETGEASPLF